MKIRYLSDLHLEFIKPNKVQNFISKIIKPKKAGVNRDDSDVLVLAGDIGNPYSQIYDLFMKEVNANFTKTFIIPGNHEYYNNKLMKDTRKYLDDYFKQYPNISFLDNGVEKYRGINFIGTTLWSHITDPAYEINDVYSIQNFDYKKYNKLNQECVGFLKEAVDGCDSCVIITHHQPSANVIDPKYKTARMLPYNQWFYCNMDDFILSNNGKIKCWIYGHTHTAYSGDLYGVPLR